MSMSEQESSVAERDDDGVADALAATATIAVIVGTIVFWLSGFPS
jgi:hypothetical protein